MRWQLNDQRRDIAWTSAYSSWQQFLSFQHRVADTRLSRILWG